MIDWFFKIASELNRMSEWDRNLFFIAIAVPLVLAVWGWAEIIKSIGRWTRNKIRRD
jgi:hypothetical protein